MDIRAALMTGANIPFEEALLIIHLPSVKEISMVGEDEFFPGLLTLCLYKSMFDDGNNLLANVTNFLIFLAIMQEKKVADKKIAVLKVLSLIFPNYLINFTPRAIICSKDGQSTLIDENNFERLLEILRNVFCLNTGPMDLRNFNPTDAKAKEIADKLMKGRLKIAEEKGQSNISIFLQYVSILGVALKMSIFEINNYTMFQLYDQVERFGLYTSWDINIRSKLAGGGSDSEPENWMKDIH